MTEDDVGGLTSHAGKFGQRIHVGRYLATVLLEKCFGHPEQ